MNYSKPLHHVASLIATIGAIFGLAALPLNASCKSGVRGPLGVSSDSYQGPPKRGGVFRTAFYTDLRSLDAAVAFDEAVASIEQLIYSKLIDFSESGDGFVPDLAERWERSDDGLTYTFFLRPNVKFHDGTALTSADVKRSFERALHPDTPCPVNSFYEKIKGFEAFSKRQTKDLEGVRTEGESRVVIELAEPDAAFLSLMALPTMSVLCKNAGTAYDPEFSRSACGSGPFKVGKYEPGVSIRLERFEGYYNPELPYLDAIEWSLLVPAFTQKLKFERGEFDYVRELSEADTRAYAESPLWKGRGEYEVGKAIQGVFLNTQMTPFNNVDLRRAVAAGIDRDQICKVRPNYAKPASRILPPAVPGYDPTPGQRYDYQAALNYMQKAGFAFDPVTKKGGYPNELTFLALNDSFYTQAAEVLQQQMAKIGLKMRIKAVSWPAFLAESARKNAVVWGNDGWSADYPDPSDFFEPMFATKSIADEESQNRSFFSNKEFDELVEKARRENDWSTRLDYYRKAEKILFDEAPWIVIYSAVHYEIWHPYVHNYRIHPALPQFVRDVWIDQEARDHSKKILGSAAFSQFSFGRFSKRVFSNRGGR